jgi:hypothetical protein
MDKEYAQARLEGASEGGTAITGSGLLEFQ